MAERFRGRRIEGLALGRGQGLSLIGHDLLAQPRLQGIELLNELPGGLLMALLLVELDHDRFQRLLILERGKDVLVAVVVPVVARR